MKTSVLRWQVSTREILLLTALVALSIFGAHAQKEASRAKNKLRALIPNCEIRIYSPRPDANHALGGRFQHTGVIRFPVDAVIPKNLNVRSCLEDPISGEKYAELSGAIGHHNDAGVYFEVELPPLKYLPTRPKNPGTYICIIEAFDGDDRIAMAATPMTFVPSP